MADEGESTTTTVAPVKATAGGGAPPPPSQLAKMRDANNKYKALLKMAKERIQAQEEELESLKVENKKIKDKNWKESGPTSTTSNNNYFSSNSSRRPSQEFSSPPLLDPSTNTTAATMESSADNIVKVCQRIKTSATTTNDDEEIYALFEYEVYNPEMSEATSKRFKAWKYFDSESALVDYIRRDTGEPLVLPAYSLTPAQSKEIQNATRAQVSTISEEFRRFRVKAEIMKKQADAQIRELHNTNVMSATRRIEGEDLERELEQARTDHAQLERLKVELAEQEAHWKEAYQVLMTENSALKSSGAEALLAAQWRQRYEMLLKEKEEVAGRLQMQIDKADVLAEQRRKVDSGKYEMKYRDLKESFRLYRKKAKEIFEAQQRGDVGLVSIADSGSRDAKLSYVKNLMVNYLSSDQAVRDHMEGAIATILKFTPDEIARIEKKKQEQESWF